MSNGDEPKKVSWGTASLKSGFSGIIRVSEIRKSEKSFDNKPPADQLYWQIEPTSYEAPDKESWPQAWYNISDKDNSVWGKLQERLEELKCLPKNGADDLVGLEFEFERKTIEFGTDRDGNMMSAKNKLMPKKLIRDTKKGGKTKGEAKASSAPSSEAPAETKGKLDIESMILAAVEVEPLNMQDFFAKMNKQHQLARIDVFRAMKALEKQGMVKLDSEGGVLLKAD